MSVEWTPPPRPQWLTAFLAESRSMDVPSMVSLDADELIATAVRHTGLTDFGPDDWREPFALLTQSLKEEADLHLWGRLMTRTELLNGLEQRLQIEAAFTAHPEINDEVIDRPIIIVGLPRSGTSILHEILAQDERLMAPSSWELLYPAPPPEAASYRTDPRIERAHHLFTQYARVAPTFEAMHEMGAWVPNECAVAFKIAFRSGHTAGLSYIPTYANWLFAADLTPAYRYYRRILQLLQWRNPRMRWLLKSPDHQPYLPTLFNVFPDAQVVLTHRDPLRAQASATNMIGTLYWMRSDRSFDAAGFESLLDPRFTAQRLNQMIDWIEQGVLPRQQLIDMHYSDLMADPSGSVQALYDRLGIEWSTQARHAAKRHLQSKPKGKFGAHLYKTEESNEVRAYFERYQRYFSVQSEGGSE